MNKEFHLNNLFLPMHFLHPEDASKELTYQDVFLMPQFSDIPSRMNVDLSPQDGTGMTLPIIVSNMTAVAGKRMAEAVTRRGGMVVLTQDMSFERIEEIVKATKISHPVFETPVVLDENESVQTALNLINKRAHKAVIIVDKQNKPVGIFTEKDAYRRDRYNRLHDVMTKDLITVQDHLSPKEIFQTLHDRRVSIVPVVNESGFLSGVMTKKGCVRSVQYRPALNKSGHFLTAAAVRVRSGLDETLDRLQQIGVDMIVLDTAHGHQKTMIDAIKKARAIVGPEKPIMAGNIVGEAAARDLIDAGASHLKVGVGPGAACKTRMATGVGRPQFSAVYETAKYARAHGAFVCADGGVKHPRDVALALAAGAHSVMVGTWFAGTYESPADVQFDEQGRMYKEQFGMASRRAVTNRTENTDPFEQAQKEFFEEGVSQTRMYLNPGQESVEDIIDEITAGLRSACTYSGARTLNEFNEKAIIGVQTSAGFEEGKPVQKSWI